MPHPQGTATSSTHQRFDECNGRPVVERRTHSQHGMESTPNRNTRSLEPLVSTRHRSVCNNLQQKTGALRQPLSRRRGSGDRCNVDVVEPLESIRLSTVCITQKSITKTRKDRKLRNDNDHPLLAKPSLVCDSQRSQSGNTNTTASEIRSSETTSTRTVQSEPKNTQLTRLETIQRQLNKVGLPKGVTDILSKAIRPSTQRLYAIRWKSFTKWCISNNVTALEASVTDILKYLDYLRLVAKVTPGTITGHKTAVVMTILNATGTDLRGFPIIKNYIKGLKTLETPRSTVPPWDLALVLNALRKTPFEPLQSCNLKYLTFKTVFLVAFATAARRSELHAISKDFSRDKKWTHVTLKMIDGFVAKNQLSDCHAQSFRSFVIKSLTDFKYSTGLTKERLL